MENNKLEKAFLEITKNWNDSEVKSAWITLEKRIKETQDFYDWFNKKNKKLTIKLPQLLTLDKKGDDKRNWVWTSSIIEWTINDLQEKLKDSFIFSSFNNGFGFSEKEKVEMLIDMLKKINKQIKNNLGQKVKS